MNKNQIQQKIKGILLLTFGMVLSLPSKAISQESIAAPTSSLVSDKAAQISNMVVSLSCEETRFVKLINIYRSQLRLSTLKVAKYGVQAARWHANNMGRLHYFDHTEPNGRNAFDRMKSFNYPGQSENIAAGNSDSGKTFCQWKTSPGHDRNMRGVNWTSLSIGHAAIPGSQFTNYWSSGFTSKDAELIAEPLTTMSACVMPTQLPVCRK
ncbi:MAG: CAP domain-containing protein [Bdellovibrionaceae bacterium]|nr:CAP domain-containing protein [Bdellovibrio sp.]